MEFEERQDIYDIVKDKMKNEALQNLSEDAFQEPVESRTSQQSTGKKPRLELDGLYDSSSDEEGNCTSVDTVSAKVDAEFQAYMHSKFPEDGNLQKCVAGIIYILC